MIDCIMSFIIALCVLCSPIVEDIGVCTVHGTATSDSLSSQLIPAMIIYLLAILSEGPKTNVPPLSPSISLFAMDEGADSAVHNQSAVSFCLPASLSPLPLFFFRSVLERALRGQSSFCVTSNTSYWRVSAVRASWQPYLHPCHQRQVRAMTRRFGMLKAQFPNVLGIEAWKLPVMVSS